MSDYKFDAATIIDKSFRVCAQKRGAKELQSVIVDSKPISVSSFIQSDLVKSYLYLLSNTKAHVLFRRKIFDAQVYGNQEVDVVVLGTGLVSSPFEAYALARHSWLDWMQDADLRNDGKLDFSQPLNSWRTFTRNQHGEEINPVNMSKIVFIDYILSSPIFGEEFLGALIKSKKAMENIEIGMSGLNMNR